MPECGEQAVVALVDQDWQDAGPSGQVSHLELVTFAAHTEYHDFMVPHAPCL